jgi:hypothetical protein
MKKIMLMHIAIALCLILIIPGASSQTITGFAKTEIRTTGATTQDVEVLSTGTVRENMKDITIKAVREFIKKFGSVQNVTWHKNDGGFVAEFMNDSVQTMVGYKSDGSWNYILKRYAEKKMSRDLRRLVKSTFFDYAIMEVTEITLPYSEDNIIYRVMIKNEDNFKILRIYNGDMEIAGDYTRP